MGLHQERSKTINEGIYRKSIETIPTPKIVQSSLWTNQVHTSEIWKEDPIQNGGYITRTNRQTENHIQQVCGKFLYNRRGVDVTQLHSLNELSIKVTEGTQAALIQFLNYITSNPDATIIYRVCDMILLCESDAAYLVAPT